MKDRWFIVIQNFMIEDLKLSGVELLVYAFIRGFSVEKETQGYLGSLETLSKRCGCGLTQCKKVINKLIQRKLIVKESRPGYTSIFRVCFEAEQQELIKKEDIEEAEPEEKPEKERADCYKEYRDAYSEIREKEGYPPTQLLSARINARLKEWVKDKGVTVGEFKAVLQILSKQNFVKNNLQFEFSQILSYNVFNPILLQVRSQNARTKTESITYKEAVCPECGGSLLSGFGTCINCHPDIYHEELKLLGIR